jgi:Putative prokaryotic signal transducing protein
MRELIRTNDAVLLTYLEAVLNDAGVPHEILDAYSSVVDGSIPMVQRRVMVLDHDYDEAQKLVKTAITDLPTDHDSADDPAAG